MKEQFYQITVNDAVSMYQVGDITAKEALKLWIRIKLKEGWETKVSFKSVMI